MLKLPESQYRHGGERDRAAARPLSGSGAEMLETPTPPSINWPGAVHAGGGHSSPVRLGTDEGSGTGQSSRVPAVSPVAARPAYQVTPPGLDLWVVGCSGIKTTEGRRRKRWWAGNSSYGLRS